jgi:hypothetical protein
MPLLDPPTGPEAAVPSMWGEDHFGAVLRTRIGISNARPVQGCPQHLQRVGIRRPQGANPRGFRMPLAEPGVRLSLRTGLSLDVYA